MYMYIVESHSAFYLTVGRFFILLHHMASGMSWVYLTDMSNKHYSFQFPNATFRQTTISDFKHAIEQKTGVESQRLLYGNKELQTKSHGIEMTFGDYGITGGSTIIIVIRLSGGGGSNFVPLSFTDITSGDKFKPRDFHPSAPDWRNVEEGLNFEGTCKKITCDAYNKSVLVPKGFYNATSGQCMVNYELTQLKCPMCATKLNKRNVTGVGIYKCKLEVKAKMEDQDEIRYKIQSMDKFKLAHSLNEDDKIDYEYIILTVKRL